jgi:hypothetical protein
LIQPCFQTFATLAFILQFGFVGRLCFLLLSTDEFFNRVPDHVPYVDSRGRCLFRWRLI